MLVALLVVYDLFYAIDNRKHILVTLLDNSAAFDTIDYAILFRRLQNNYGLRENAVEWLKSYLNNHHQAVSINGVISEQYDLTYGMPKGL